ncbi:cytochrome P450 [Marasmius fiardii PR-910]|nr:cytochrome P450 [Marasmius fiardii PR-910]
MNSTLFVAELLAASVLLYRVLQLLYRFAFHPLRKFPGPTLAALTHYYRGYYEIFCNGGWIDHLEKLHARYGPAVRVGPNEVDFSAPDAYDEIVGKHPKYHGFYKALAKPDAEALTAITDHQEAAKRRTRIGSFFSRRAVLQLQHVIQEKVDKLTRKLSSYAASDCPVNMTFAYRATTLDVITSYLFAQEINTLDYPDFQHPMLSTISKLLQNIWFSKYFPIPTPEQLPEFLVRHFLPMALPVLDQQKRLSQQLEKLANEPPSTDKLGHRVIFDAFLDEKSDGRTSWVIPRAQLLDEALGLQIAGSDTVANTCMIGTYHVLSNPKVLSTLRRELDEFWSSVLDDELCPKCEKLERLPYLTAVIKESLRLSHGATSPLPRFVSQPGSTVLGTTIPKGTVVSCASYFVHMDPHIFPDPTEFSPERWLEPGSARLDRYLVTFSKGPRMCIGINLAWCELYLIFANVFRKLDMKVYNTTESDIRFRDHYLPTYPGDLNVHVLSTRLGISTSMDE